MLPNHLRDDERISIVVFPYPILAVLFVRDERNRVLHVNAACNSRKSTVDYTSLRPSSQGNKKSSLSTHKNLYR